jgi:hypothetical protein
MYWHIRQWSYHLAGSGKFRNHRYRGRGEVLEARRLLSGQITLTGATAISSFAGIGFALNPVASFVDKKDRQCNCQAW